MAEYLAGYIAAVKADAVVPALEREFFDRADRVSARHRGPASADEGATPS